MSKLLFASRSLLMAPLPAGYFKHLLVLMLCHFLLSPLTHWTHISYLSYIHLPYLIVCQDVVLVAPEWVFNHRVCPNILRKALIFVRRGRVIHNQYYLLPSNGKMGSPIALRNIISPMTKWQKAWTWCITSSTCWWRNSGIISSRRLNME